MKFTKFKFDTVKETDGVWCIFEQAEDPAQNCEVKIARLHTPAYDDTIRKLSKPFQKSILDNTVPTATLEEIQTRAAAQCLVKDWKNIEDDEGNPMPFSKENAYRVMTEARDFFKTVMSFAGQSELYRLDAKEQAGGNS